MGDLFVLAPLVALQVVVVWWEFFRLDSIASKRGASSMKSKLFYLCCLSIFGVSCTQGGRYYDPNYRGVYNNDYRYGSDYRRERYNDRERERLRDERRSQDREWERLERERARLDRERERVREQGNRRPPARPPVASRPQQSQSAQSNRCPQGFKKSNRRCTNKERKNGCKDLRTPSGQGCISR